MNDTAERKGQTKQACRLSQVGCSEKEEGPQGGNKILLGGKVQVTEFLNDINHPDDPGDEVGY